MDGRHLLITLLAVAVAGCFDELGDYEATTPPGGGTGGDDHDPSTGTGAAATSTGTGTEPVAEACSNGTDDDGDGKVDCADEDCGGYMCIPAPLDAAFTGGPHLLVPPDGAGCGPAFPDPGIEGVRVVAAPSPCDCTCADATAQSCTGTASIHAAPGCSGGGTTAPIGPTCGAAPAGGASVSAFAAPSGGSCTGSPVAPVPPTFEPARTCSAARGGGCEAGFVCARPPAPDADGAPSLCFERAGDQVCDDPIYATKVLVFDDTPVDNRTCSGACTCDPPEGGACSGSLTIKDGGCAGTTVATLTLGEACSTLPAPAATPGLTLTATVGSAGTCSPNPRTERGALEGVAHTLCCAEAF